MPVYPIIPYPKPRMTRRDKWKKRDPVIKYKIFCDLVRLHKVELPEQGAYVIFRMPMPPSWSEKKKKMMEGKPHQQKPDLDNLLKALGDAVYENDCGIWHITAMKVWGRTGQIEIIPDESCK